MSLLDDAKENLEQHGVDVDMPETVEFHDRLNSQSEVLSSFGIQDGLEAATYSHVDNRIDVYNPLAISRVINELEETEIDQLTEAFRRNKDQFSSEIRRINAGRDKRSFSDSVNIARLQYKAAQQDESVDEELKNKLKSSIEEQILHDSEHELVHASHYQEFIDGSVESLQDDFDRYFEDVKHVNKEMNEFEKREQQEGISSLMDIEMAAAMKFLEEDRLQNIVSIAGREHHKWERKVDEVSEKYEAKKEEVKSDIIERLDLRGEFAFDRISSNMAGYLGEGLNVYSLVGNDAGNEFDSVEDFVDHMEEDEVDDVDEVDEYMELREQGIEKEEISDALSKIHELDQAFDDEKEQPQRYSFRTGELLENAILREAELQGDFKGFMKQYADRLDQGAQMPDDFTEAYAQFWSAYRRGDLEEDRENIFQSLEGYDIEGIEDTMEDILGTYDELEGSQEERVTEIMSSQIEYLENNYDIDI